MTRRLLVLCLVALPVLLAPAAASAMRRPEHRAYRMVNSARLRHDRRAVSPRTRLMRYAERHARAMARHRRLYHSALRVSGFSSLGECVGSGGSVRQVQRAFMRSSAHRSIILGRYRWVGIGVAHRNGIRYVTEVFAK
jgi:uncharacterized protein YkwD